MKMKSEIPAANLSAIFLALAAAALPISVPAAPAAQENSSETSSEISSEIPPETAPGEALKIRIGDAAEITVSGYVQAQYYCTDSRGNGGNACSGFSVRRAGLIARGDLGENWSAEFGIEIKSNSASSSLDGAYVDKAIIAYANEFGTLSGGYKKTAFAFEEYSPWQTALATEHGIATRYFTRSAGFKTLTMRHGGIWWDGKIALGDAPAALKYTLALTNQYQDDFSRDDNDGVAALFSLSCAFAREHVKFEIGVNGAFNPGNDSTDADGNFTSQNSPHGAVFGLEPFATLKAGDFTGVLDFLWGDGDADAGIAGTAWGLNLTGAYRIGNFEPVLRFSYVDAGKNANLGPDLLFDTPAGTKDHDTAGAIYVGANYYVNANVKIAVGYQYTNFDGGEKSEYASAFRTQIQAEF